MLHTHVFRNIFQFFIQGESTIGTVCNQRDKMYGAHCYFQVFSFFFFPLIHTAFKIQNLNHIKAEHRIHT